MICHSDNALKRLEINIDPIKSAEVSRIVEIKLTDQHN
jgi:hypothetical protein